MEKNTTFPFHRVETIDGEEAHVLSQDALKYIVQLKTEVRELRERLNEEVARYERTKKSIANFLLEVQ